MFKPTSQTERPASTGEQKEFVPVIPQEGLDIVQIGLLVNLGQHKKLPKFAKDSQGNIELDEDGNEKIIVPKEGKDLEQRVAAYVDLTEQTHDWGGDIGIKNIRLPLHETTRGVSEGLNFVTVAPRDPKTNEYIKGRQWLVAGTSQWSKIAKVAMDENGKPVADTMLDYDYKNKQANNIGLLLGRPFNANIDVKVTEKDGKTFVNTKVKSPVPLSRKDKPTPALIAPVSISFNDTDLLEAKEELGGARKIDMVRVADLRKIVLAVDYQGSEIQKAIREVHNEAELITKAKEAVAKALETNKEYQRVLDLLAERAEQGGDETPTQVPEKAKPAKEASVPQKATNTFDDFEDDIPF